MQTKYKVFYSYNPDIIYKKNFQMGKKYPKLKISNSFIIFMLVIFYTRKCYAAVKNAMHIYIYVALGGTDS